MEQIELRIEGSVEEGWTAQWSLEGVVAGSEIRVGAADSARLAAAGRRFLALFEQGVRPLVDPVMLSSLGAELARSWLDPARAALATALSAGGGELVIAGNDSRALDLPWELIELHLGLPVGCDAAWTLRREAIADGAARSNVPVPPPEGGPLRILFLASSPEDQEPLDLEREEDLVLRPTEGLRGEVIVHIAEVGTFDELKRLVGRIKPQVIHLSGHGNLTTSGEGVFAFETEEGETDSRTADQIAASVGRGASVRLFVLNACKSAQAGTAGLCRALTEAGVPHALGWAANIGNDVAIRFAAALYGKLMVGAPVGRAVANARWELRDEGGVETHEGPKVDASFTLSQLYGSGAGDLIDLDKPKETYDGPSTEYALLGDGVKGLKEGFIGHRRAVWKVLRAMRRGQPATALLWGIGGAGKSTLATRVANRLRDDGFDVLPVRAPDGDDPAAIGGETRAKLVGAIEVAFEKAGREDLLDVFRSDKIAPKERLCLAVEGLCEVRALLVLDNLEGALALETRHIVDPDLAFLLQLLATVLTRGSRLLITCRYEIADLAGLGVLGLEVKDFRASDVRKFFRRDKKIEERLHRGEIPLWLFDRLATELGGTPRFLETARTILRTADSDELVADLDGLESGPLTEERREYLEKILAQRLYEALSPKARSLASHLAVSVLPLPIDGAARIARCGEDLMRIGLAEAVGYGLLQIFEEPDLPDLYHPPGLLRPWLVAAGLSQNEARAAHTEFARFWRDSYEQDREDELRVPIEAELNACRFHAAVSGEREAFGWATVRLANRLVRRAEWRAAWTLLEEIPEANRSAEAWHALGTIDVLESSYIEALEKLGHALVIEQATGDREGEAATLTQLASINVLEGSYGEARGMLNRALAIHRAIGDRAGEAKVWNQLGTIDSTEGFYTSARENFERSLAVLQVIGDHAWEAATIANLGTIALNEGSNVEAREKLRQALGILQAIGDRAGEAATWHQLGTIDIREGSYEAARENFRRSLAIKQAIGDRAGEAATWHQLGTVDVEECSYVEARESFARSLAIKQAIGDRAGEAATWHQLGSIDVEEGSYVEARENLGRSLAIEQSIGDRAGEAATWHQLGSVALSEGSYAEARKTLDQALAILQSIGDRGGEAATWHQLATIAFREGSYAEAREKLEKELAIVQAIGDRAGEAATLHQLGTIALREGVYVEARDKLEKELAIVQAIGQRYNEGAAFYQLGVLAERMGRPAAGAPLVALCFLIDKAIGHGDAKTDFENLLGLCQQLRYGEPEIRALLAKVQAEYERDCGQALLEEAFADFLV